jgi:hypothetical protein
MAVGFPTKVNYLTGDVLTATNMNDVSGTVNLLNGAQYAAGKNRVLNSNYSVWQRGTSISATASSTPYTADRWQIYTNANQATTISRQTTSDTTNLPNIQYCARVQRNSGQTGTGQYNFGQSFESINSIPLAGKTVVLSFYARAGANYSAASSILQGIIWGGTGTDQNRVTSSYTGDTIVGTANSTLTTTWQRFTITGTVGSTLTELSVNFLFTPVGTASTNDYFEVTGVQLEASTTAASAYTPNSSTYQAELAACQRYYFRNSGASTNNIILGFTGSPSTAILASYAFQPPVTMRVTPTAIEFANIQAVDGVAGYALSALALDSLSNPSAIRFTAAATGMTTFRPLYMNASAASAYLGISAEL